jgi:hypothetical protein
MDESGGAMHRLLADDATCQQARDAYEAALATFLACCGEARDGMAPLTARERTRRLFDVLAAPERLDAAHAAVVARIGVLPPPPAWHGVRFFGKARKDDASVPRPGAKIKKNTHQMRLDAIRVIRALQRISE